MDILYVRSSDHPTEYAIVLREKIDGEWVGVLCADNSHEGRAGVDEHHLHHYTQEGKSDPEPLPFAVRDTNDAMFKVIDWMTENWESLVQRP
ncbi:MAG TPA: hypothetical protein VIL49_16640 [Capillimicrobium sp.]